MASGDGARQTLIAFRSGALPDPNRDFWSVQPLVPTAQGPAAPGISVFWAPGWEPGHLLLCAFWGAALGGPQEQVWASFLLEHPFPLPTPSSLMTESLDHSGNELCALFESNNLCLALGDIIC